MAPVSRPDAGVAPWWRSVASAAVGIFLATRLVCLAALYVGARHTHKSFGHALGVFDGAYYRQIATHWYPHVLASAPHGTLAPSTLAFFPLYPSLLGLLRLAGAPLTAGALLIDFLAGGAAAAVIALTVERWSPERLGLLTAALWSAYPLAVVLSLTYSEALFTLLAAGALLALSRERYVIAAGCVALACLTRPTGLVLVLVCLAVALKHRQLRPAGVAMAGLLAFAGWMAYLDELTGSATAWLTTERRGWNVYYDGGVNSVSRAAHYLLHPAQRPAATAVALMLIALVALLVAAWWQPIPRRYWAYSVLLFLEAVGTHNAYSSIPRFMLPAFPVLVPLASLLQRVPRAVTWSLVAAAAAAMAVAGVYLALYSTYPP
ncbi:MAG: hypothetical protein ACLPQS_04400 [Acidimicrobiales bacterium]